MSALPKAEPYMDVDEYLELETASPFRHELVDGVMYAMSGASNKHHAIAFALQGMLHALLRGQRCLGYNANMKLKLPSHLGDEDSEFCYPDAMICCDPVDCGEARGHAYRERPSVIFEVLSTNTRLFDELRKRPSFLAIPSLEVFVRLEQDRPELIVDRKVDGAWVEERLSGLDAVLQLPTIGIDLPLAEIYERVNFET
jgi:Uma2 family endonuclease